LSGWVTVPGLPDEVMSKLQAAKAEKAAAARANAPAQRFHVKTKPASGIDKKPGVMTPASYLTGLAEQQPEAKRGPESFDEIAASIWGENETVLP